MGLLAEERQAIGTALKSMVQRRPELEEDRGELISTIYKYVAHGYDFLDDSEAERLNFLLDELKQ